jgi:hypothetical protein
VSGAIDHTLLGVTRRCSLWLLLSAECVNVVHVID